MSHIGLDLDNTIIDYDNAFPSVGVQHGLLPASAGLRSKRATKAYLLDRPDGMTDWMSLQGLVYGQEIGTAQLYAGAAEFIVDVTGAGHRVSIVSHKTCVGHFDLSGTNLRQAALSFLCEARLVGEGNPIAETDVHFLDTRETKVQRIGELGLAAFVDDLTEVLLHPDFPPNVRRILFSRSESSGDRRDKLLVTTSWHQIRELLLEE